MATIANLVVKVVADVAELRQRLDEAARRTEAWARQTNQAASTVAKAMRGHGTLMASGFLEGLERTFQQDALEARELLFRGLIDRTEFRQRGAQAAADFNQGILQGIEALADARALSAELNAKLVGALKESGLRAGEEFGQGMVHGMQHGTGALKRVAESTGMLGQIVDRTTGRFTSLGRRAVPVVTNIAFGFESVVRGSAAAESGARAALRSISTFAGVFGPQGLLVAGIAAAMSAAIDFFRRSRDEMTKTREAFEQDLKRMIDAGDTLAMQQRMAELWRGKPSAGLGMGGAFKGSIVDLREQLTDVTIAMDVASRTWNLRAYNKLKQQKEDLERRLRPLQEEFAKLAQYLQNPLQVPAAVSGLGSVTATGMSDTGRAAAELKALGDAVERVVALQKVADDTQAGVPGLLEQQLALYDKIARALAAQTDPLSEQAQTLQKMLGTMRELESVRIFRLGVSPATGLGARPNITTTAWPALAPPAPVTAAGITPAAQLLADQARELTAWGEAMRRTRQHLEDFGYELQVRVATLQQQFTKPAETLRSAGQAVADTLLSLAERASPLSLLFAVLDGLLQGVEPLMKAFLAPLTAVGQVLAVLIEPVLRLLFPVIKAIAIALAFFGEIVARVTGGVARALGNFIVAIGKLIGKVPGLGGLGRSIQRLGKSFLTFADEQAENAKRLAETRKEISAMKFGDTAEAISGLGQAAQETAEQLRNVPLGFKIALDRFLATAAVGGGGGTITGPIDNAPSITVPSRGASAPIESFVINGGVHIDGAQKSGAELLDEITAAAREKARRMFGTSARAAEVFAYGQVFTTS